MGENGPTALVVRRVVEPAAVVSRAVAEQPVFAHLAEVRVGVTSVLVDPKVNYLDDEPGSIDAQHSIVKAQRAYMARQAAPTRVIRGGAVREYESGVLGVMPRAILLKPNFLDGRPGGERQMPAVPRPANKDAKLMAAAQ
jgi:hypothetical protein